MERKWLFESTDPFLVAKCLEREWGQALTQLEDDVREVATGSHKAAHIFLEHWESLVDQVLASAPLEGTEETCVGRREFLLAAGPRAVVSPWVSVMGLRRGIGLYLLAEVRTVVPAAHPLVSPSGEGKPWAEPHTVRRVFSVCESALAADLVRAARVHVPRADDPHVLALRRVMDLFALDRTDLAQLFGVTRQAVEQWEDRGIPAERWPKLTTILAVSELLTHQLQPGVLPGVARTRAEVYDGKTMLELIAADRHEWLLADVRESFDWASTA